MDVIGINSQEHHVSSSVAGLAMKQFPQLSGGKISRKRSGLDKFGNIHATVDWDKGPARHCVHNTCRLTLKKLEQAKTRQKKTRVR